MAKLTALTIDSVHPAALARFWAAALVDFEVRAYDDAEIERLAGLGLTPETDPAVAVDGPELTLFFQQVPEPPSGRNRLHLDLHPDLRRGPRPEEVARLLELGATVRDEHDDFTVLLDPEGNQFCVLDPL